MSNSHKMKESAHTRRKKGSMDMNIGILALAVAAALTPIAILGEVYNTPPKREEKRIRYPFPEELP